MTQQPIKMENLTWYLNHVEERVSALEKENKRLNLIFSEKEITNTNQSVEYDEDPLPQTNLFSPSFLKRAFAVWGHFFVAHFLISIVFLTVYLCFMMVVFGPVFGNLLQNPR